MPVADAAAVPAVPASVAANAVDALRAIRIARAVFFIINPCISDFKTSMFGLFITHHLSF
uniref:WeiE n=1 Tax=Vibrio parahaemolyticus TaxID=670 RepID=A0A5Q5AWS8_VIBPH|nr:weiE [Vibrio parahaemolyticus]